MKRIAASLALLLALAGCASTPTTSVEPGDGPAVEATEGAPAEGNDGELTPDEAKAALCEAYEEGSAEWEQFQCGEPGAFPTDETMDEPPTEEPTDTSSGTGDVATFGDKYTYEDGIEVEVTKIKLGKVSARDVDQLADDKEGTPWTQFTVRIRNGSDARLADVSASYTVTYGPDGEEATASYIPTVDDTDVSGSILPGKSKVSSDTFVIPTKYQDDVVLEFGFDYEHEAAIFAGSVK